MQNKKIEGQLTVSASGTMLPAFTSQYYPPCVGIPVPPQGQTRKSLKPRSAYFNPKTRMFGVIWKDGEKTEIHVSEEDNVVPSIGIALCLARRFFGGRESYAKLVNKIYHHNEEIELETRRDISE